MKQKKKLVLFFLIIGACIFNWRMVQAQDVIGEVDIDDEAEESVIVSTVMLRDAELINQDKNKLDIEYSIYNRENSETGLMTQVKLTQASQIENEDGPVVDLKVYPQTLSIGSDEELSRKVHYEAPGFLSGDYDVWIQLGNSSAQEFSEILVGTVTLQGSNDYVQIQSPTCYLKISEEGSNAQYTLDEGIDISNDESLQLNCQMKNNFNENIQTTANFVTFYRSVYGEKLDEVKGIDFAISFQAQEEKKVEIDLPTMQEAQAYDIELTLLGENNQVISTSLYIHYVVQGSSATIQSVRLDKESYLKGDEALISVFWTPSVDAFESSRANQQQSVKIADTILKLNITDKNGNKCFEDIQQEVNLDNVDLNFNAVALVDCKQPQVYASITDKSGKTLDQKGYEFNQEDVEVITDEGAGVAVDDVQTVSIRKILVSIFILIVIITLAAVLYEYSKKSKSNIIKSVLFLLAFTFVSLFPSAHAQALSYDSVSWAISDFFKIGQYATCGDGVVINRSHYTTSINKTSYLSGEQIIVGAKKEKNSQCSNAYSHANMGAKIQRYSNGSWVTIANSGNSALVNTGSHVAKKDKRKKGTYTITAPSVGGSYRAKFVGGAMKCAGGSHEYDSTYSSHKIYFQVYKYDCTGNVPSDATLCPGDDTMLTADTPRNLVSSCTPQRKCEYRCNSGYVLEDDQCKLPCECGPTAGVTCDTPLTSSCNLGQVALEQSFPRSLTWNCNPVPAQCDKQKQCQSTMPPLPECDYAGVTTSCSEPVAACNNGNTSSVELINNDTKWEWTCTNSCNESVTCDEIEKRCPFIEVNP